MSPTALGRSVEDDPVFRLARLTVLMAVVAESSPDGVDIERLGIYDFLAANPLLLARDDSDPDRLALLLAGFDDRALSYASPAQRYVTGQLRLRGDLARLVAHGLVGHATTGRIRYRATARGESVARQFSAMYAHSYTTAAHIVVRRLRRLSGRRLRENLRDWSAVRPGVGARLDPAAVIDVIDVSHDSEPYPTSRPPTAGTPRRTDLLEDET